MSRADEDMQKVIHLLDVMDVKCPLRDLRRLGKYAENKNRPLVLKVSAPLEKRRIFLSLCKLKGYEHKIFISKELTPDEQEIENNMLKTRRDLIQSGKFTIEMSRRTFLASATCHSNKHDILSLTEKWLTDLTDVVRSETLFIPEFEIYRCDRPSKNYQTKHCGVLIAIRNNSKHQHVPIHSNIEQITLRLIDFEKISSLICCVYCPPKLSPHRTTAFSIVDFLTKISATAKDLIVKKQ